MMPDILEKLRLDTNPFEPAATGAPLLGKLSPPHELAEKTIDLLDVQGPTVPGVQPTGQLQTRLPQSHSKLEACPLSHQTGGVQPVRDL